MNSERLSISSPRRTDISPAILDYAAAAARGAGLANVEVRELDGEALDDLEACTRWVAISADSHRALPGSVSATVGSAFVNLSVRNALITGVSRRVGIGYAIASHLLDAGAAVFIQGWTPHDADQRWGAEPGGTEVVARGLGVPFLEADFADAEAPERMVIAATTPRGSSPGFAATTPAGSRVKRSTPKADSAAGAKAPARFR